MFGKRVVIDMDVGKLGASYASQFVEPHKADGRYAAKSNKRAEGESAAAAVKAATGPQSERQAGGLLGRVMERKDYKVRLSVHEATNRVIIRVADPETGEVITEIPRENYLDMVASFLSNMDKNHGMSLDEFC
jgi:uncharacterized FlaG/YvyC family protein